MINYFGYGANRDRIRVKEILGKESKGGYGALLSGYTLGYQILDQIPEIPRKTLKEVWGENFKCYTLKKGKGFVAGVIWELDENDLEIIRKWEFVGLWKELIDVHVYTFDGEEISAVTEKVPDSAPVFGFSDGLNYENNINPEMESLIIVKSEEESIKKEISKIRSQLRVVGGSERVY